MSCGHEPIIAAANARIAELEANVAGLVAMVAKLTDLVNELQARLSLNSSNSGKPPSSDPPGAPKAPPKKPSGRKQGGQPGHPGHSRAKRDPDKVVDYYPDFCGGCDRPLFPADDVAGDEPVCHQVEELPEVRLVVTEHRCHLRRCPKCGKKTRAAMPAGVPSWHFGTRVMTTVALMSSRFRLSRREMPKVLADLFGFEISVGTIQKICERTSEVVAAPVEQIVEIVHEAPVVNADETGFPHRHKKSWLWVASCPTATIFRIHRHRNADGLAALMPDDYEGLLIVDRYKVYEKFRRSLCHAHLLRNWREIGERKDPEAKRIGKWAVTETERLLRFHRQFRLGEMSEAELMMRMRMLKARYGRLLDQALCTGDKKTVSMAKDLNRQWVALWGYLGEEGAEPTNNAGERRIRPAVLWRKGSFGTQSTIGQRFVERMMTLSATANQIGANLFGYLDMALGNNLLGQVIPSLHAWAETQIPARA